MKLDADKVYEAISEGARQALRDALLDAENFPVIIDKIAKAIEQAEGSKKGLEISRV